MFSRGDIQIAIEAPMVKNEGNQIGTYALYLSAFFNNTVFSDEIFRIHTTIGALHTDTLKTIFRCVRQNSDFS
jgi:hypothetical protein